MTRSAPSPSRELALGSLPVLLEYRNGRRWRISAGLLIEGLLFGTILTIPLLFPDNFALDPRTPQVFIPPPRRGTPEGNRDAGPRGPRQRRDQPQIQAALTTPIRIPETIGTPTDAPVIPGGGGQNPNGGPLGVPWGIEGGPGPDGPAQTTPGPPKPVPPVVQVGGQIRQPRLLRRIEPAYPRLAIAAHIEGDVVLTAIIETDGRVRQVAVKSGPPSLGPAAREAVAQWLYEPTTLNGQPVAVQLDVIVKFRLNR